MRAFRAARQWVNQTPALHVANSEIAYFPGISVEALTEAIVAYQALGCWSGQVEIVPDELAASVEVFRYGGAVTGDVDPLFVAVRPPG